MTHCGAWTKNGPCVRRQFHRGTCKAAKENRRHAFDPGGRAGWAMPRCKECREFEVHPIHEVVIIND